MHRRCALLALLSSSSPIFLLLRVPVRAWHTPFSDSPPLSSLLVHCTSSGPLPKCSGTSQPCFVLLLLAVINQEHVLSAMHAGAGPGRQAYLIVDTAEVILAECACREDISHLGKYPCTASRADASALHLDCVYASQPSYLSWCKGSLKVCIRAPYNSPSMSVNVIWHGYDKSLKRRASLCTWSRAHLLHFGQGLPQKLLSLLSPGPTCQFCGPLCSSKVIICCL